MSIQDHITISILRTDKQTFIRVAWPYDGKRHHEEWVTRNPIPSIDLHTYKDDTPINVELALPPNYKINIEEW
jgi:hypothetical protein